MKTYKKLFFLVLALSLILSFFLFRKTKELNRTVSVFTEKHIDSLIMFYKFIQPYKYYDDTIVPTINIDMFKEDSLFKQIENEKKTCKVVKTTLASLSIIDWIKEEEFLTEIKGNNLVLSVKYKYIDLDKLLKEAKDFNNNEPKVYLMPNPRHPYFELIMQNTVIFQYLIFNKPHFNEGYINMIFSKSADKLKLEEFDYNGIRKGA